MEVTLQKRTGPGGKATIRFNDMTTVSFTLGAGDDQLDITHAVEDSKVDLNLGAGADLVNVGDASGNGVCSRACLFVRERGGNGDRDVDGMVIACLFVYERRKGAGGKLPVGVGLVAVFLVYVGDSSGTGVCVCMCARVECVCVYIWEYTLLAKN